MSDAGDSGGIAKKKSFSARISSKLHNPFKRGDSDSGSDSSRSPMKVRKGKSSIIPPMPSHFTLSPNKPQNVSDPVDKGLARGEAERAVPQPAPIPQQRPPQVAPPNTATGPVVPSPGVSTADKPPIYRASSNRSSPQPPRPAASPGAAPSTGASTAPATSTPATSAAPRQETPSASEKPRKVVGGPVYGAPEIVLTGVKGDPDVVMKSLRARGFVVHLAMLHDETAPPTMTMVLAMGPKLLVKCAVERHLPTKAFDDYSSGEVSQLCTDATKVVQRSGVEYGEVTLLHDRKALKAVAKATAADTPDLVNSYFGPYIGIYFAWLGFYTKALLLPTAAGMFLFLDQWRTGSPDSPLLPIFCVLIVVWTALFLDLWRRRNSEISFKWGVEGIEDEELMRVSAETRKAGEFKPDPAGKLCVTVPIIIAATYAVIRAMLYCIWLSDHAVEVYGDESYMQYYPLMLHSIVPLVASTAFGYLAKALNDFEEHPTPVRKKNMLVIKMFAFQFVNSYCALLYVAFWLRDLERLRTLMMTMMMVKQFIAQLVEKYQPIAIRWWKDRNEKNNPPKEPTFLVQHTGTISPEDLHEEMKAEPADVEDDFLEMVLQFGYLSMFAVVFPLSPLFAVLNNIWEFKLDLSVLVKTRRPQVHAESTIGAWQLCLEMIGIVSCMTNVLLVVLVSDKASMYVPKSFSEQLGSFEGKVVLAVGAEHLLFLFKAISSQLIDKVPKVVRDAQAVMALQQQEERKEFRRLASGLPAPPTTKRGPMGEFTPRDRLRELHQAHDVWKFGPRWYLPLAVVPFLIAWFEVSAVMVLPIAFVFVSYLQHHKDKADKALALGIVKDPKVLELVTSFLPPWYTDSEVERVNWMNKILDKMWNSASRSTEALFHTTIQPILDSYRPAGVNALGFRKVSLGSIPPKIVGVRALETKEDKVIIDIDLRWAGNAEVVVEAGVKPVPLLVTLNKICFSGRMRVELAPLVPVFPCFGAVVLTFMEKPFIDFNFSLGKLEVMSIGPGDMNVGNLVSETIKNIVTNLMVFPVKMVVPILYEQDILALANPTPSGVVQLVVVGADKLRAADFGGKSDPYVKIKLGLGQEMKTEYKKRTLNPRFDEEFDLLVYEQSVEVMEFDVYDRDSGPSDDDFLGSCELPLSVLVPDVESSHNIPLSSTSSGSLLIRATFVPLSSGAKRTEEVDDDVIVSVASDIITDETVADDIYQKLPPSTGQAAPRSASASPPQQQKGPVDPSTLKPMEVIDPSGSSIGVVSVMGMECKGVKPGDRYLTVMCGNTKRKTAVVQGMSEFVCPEVFHFLIKGTNSAVVEILLKEKETIGNDKMLGSFKVKVAEVMANDDQLDGEWDLLGNKAKGSVKMRLKWSGRTGVA